MTAWPWLVLMPKSDQLMRVRLLAWTTDAFVFSCTAHLSCITRPRTDGRAKGGYSLREILEDEEVGSDVCYFCKDVIKKEQ